MVGIFQIKRKLKYGRRRNKVNNSTTLSASFFMRKADIKKIHFPILETNWR